MIPVTLSAPGYAAVTVNLMPAGQGAASSSPPPASDDTPIVATWTAIGYEQYESPHLPAGGSFAISVTVADTDSGVDVFQFSQAGTLGGAFKDVVISDAPGKFDGIVVGKNLNSAALPVGVNYPAYGINLTPGTWYLNVRLHNPGAVIVIKTAQ